MLSFASETNALADSSTATRTSASSAPATASTEARLEPGGQLPHLQRHPGDRWR